MGEPIFIALANPLWGPAQFQKNVGLKEFVTPVPA